MSEWWTYRLSSFVMYSSNIYWRLVERYNREVWPLQIVMVAAGAVLLWWVAARRPLAGRAAAGVLAAVWLWVGWAFYWQRYATINWAARYFVAAFVLQALLLLAAAVIGKGRPAPGHARTRAIGLALAAVGVLLYPFIEPAAGRPWSQTEVFGVMPEPTALATLGLLFGGRMPHRGWLAVIPTLSLGLGLALMSALH
jgi:peptidoglycan/LPS O-acetylase OafA/YrhL